MTPAEESGSRKRILALDGGGVRGVFTIEILARMEELLRQNLQKPQLVLADHFQFMAGSSAGAILATFLSWGTSMDTLRRSYGEQCAKIFPKRTPWRVWEITKLLRALYGAEAISGYLKDYFYDEETGQPALLGTKKLKTTLLVCMRNASTGSAWPITNNPNAKYNQAHLADCNLNIPLWKLVRASTAAPVYFLPEEIEMGKVDFKFVDGGITPYNNPALIAYLMATLPFYRMDWPVGTRNLLVVSLGTGRMRSVMKNPSLFGSNIGASLLHVPSALMENISLQQDFLCRVLGQCRFGDDIDSEVGNLVEESKPESANNKKFDYVRYDHRFTDDEMAAATKASGPMTLNNIRSIPFFTELGRKYAEKNVAIEHLL